MVRSVAVLLLLTGCGPAVESPAEEGSASGAATSSDPGPSNSGPLPVTSSVGGEDSASSSSSSTGWEPTNCDPSCQLPALEEQWSFGGADALGAPPKSGRDYFFTAFDAGRRTWIATEQVASGGSALVRIEPGGRTQLSAPESLGIPEGAVVGIPFTGATESLIVYYSEERETEGPVLLGLVKLDEDGEVLCTQSSSPVVWAEAKQTETGDWALLGSEINVESARPAYVGDPCGAFAEVYLPLRGSSITDFDYFDDRFVVVSAVNGETSVRAFDDTGAEVSSWSSEGDPRIEVGWWAGRTPDGRMLLTDTYGSGQEGTTIVLAYVDLETQAASIYEYPGLWEFIDPPRVVVDFDAADVPWMMFGLRDLRISPLPTEEGEPCCPTVTDVWVRNAPQSSWALYGMPDGLIAATSAVPQDGGPEDIIVSRFSFTR